MIHAAVVCRRRHSRKSRYSKGSDRYGAGCTAIIAPRTNLCCFCLHLRPFKEAIDGFHTRLLNRNSGDCSPISAPTADPSIQNIPSGGCETTAYGSSRMKQL